MIQNTHRNELWDEAKRGADYSHLATTPPKAAPTFSESEIASKRAEFAKMLPRPKSSGASAPKRGDEVRAAARRTKVLDYITAKGQAATPVICMEMPELSRGQIASALSRLVYLGKIVRVSSGFYELAQK